MGLAFIAFFLCALAFYSLLWQRRLPARQAAIVDVEVGIEERLTLRTEVAGWAFSHSLIFCSLA
jgi:hypothetical protein